jgi:hypothetical protein
MIRLRPASIRLSFGLLVLAALPSTRAQTAGDLPDTATHAALPQPVPAVVRRAPTATSPGQGERIAFLGNGLAERDLYYGLLETELHLRYPDRKLIIRNFGRPGDTPGYRPHPARTSPWAFPGAEAFRPEFALHNGKGFFPTPDQWLTSVKADTVVAFFGYNESFDGPAGVGAYEAELEAFVLHTLAQAYNGEAAPRLILVSPIAFENLSARRDLPNGTRENENLALYTEAMRRVASRHGLTFIDLFADSRALRRPRPHLHHQRLRAHRSRLHRAGPLLADGLYGAEARRSPRPTRPGALRGEGEKTGCGTTTTTCQRRPHPRPAVRALRSAELSRRDPEDARDDVAARHPHPRRCRRAGRDLPSTTAGTHTLPPVPTNFKPGGAMGTITYAGGQA